MKLIPRMYSEQGFDLVTLKRDIHKMRVSASFRTFHRNGAQYKYIQDKH